MNTWVSGKDLTKYHYLIKSILQNLYTEEIKDVGYRHGERVWEYLKIKNLGEYHDLYVQNNTLLLADLFDNFGNKCIEIYEPDPTNLFSALVLAWQAFLKKAGVKLELQQIMIC